MSRLAATFQQVLGFREPDADTPVVLKGYANPIERYDQLLQPSTFAVDAATAGMDVVQVVYYPLNDSGDLDVPEPDHTFKPEYPKT